MTSPLKGSSDKPQNDSNPNKPSNSQLSQKLAFSKWKDTQSSVETGNQKRRKLDEVGNFRILTTEQRKSKLELIDDYEHQAEKSTDDTKKLEHKKNAYKLALQVEQSDHKGLQDRFSEQQKTLAELKQRAAEDTKLMQSKLESYKKREAGYHKEIDKLKKDVQSKQSTIEEQNKTITSIFESAERNKDFKKEIETLKRQLDLYEVDQEAIKQLKSTNTQLTTEFNAKTSELEASVRAQKELQSNSEVLLKDLKERIQVFESLLKKN